MISIINTKKYNNIIKEIETLEQSKDLCFFKIYVEILFTTLILMGVYQHIMLKCMIIMRK